MALAVTAEMMEALSFHKETARHSASDPALLATDLADELVRGGMPFRNAHDVVGKLASESVRRGVPLDQLPEELLLELCPSLVPGWKELFDPIRSLRARSAVGGPSPENVAGRLAHWKSKLAGK